MNRLGAGKIFLLENFTMKSKFQNRNNEFKVYSLNSKDFNFRPVEDGEIIQAVWDEVLCVTPKGKLIRDKITMNVRYLKNEDAFRSVHSNNLIDWTTIIEYYLG